VQHTGVGTDPADPAAAGQIDKQEFVCSHYINFREREMNPDRSFSLAIVVFCNLPHILLSVEPLYGEQSLTIGVPAHLLRPSLVYKYTVDFTIYFAGYRHTRNVRMGPSKKSTQSGPNS